MTLVDVPHCGLQFQCAQCTHATDTENDLLLDANVTVTAVQLRRQLTILRAVAGYITVQQVEMNMTDIYLPYPEVDRSFRQVDLHGDRLAISIQCRHHRHVG